MKYAQSAPAASVGILRHWAAELWTQFDTVLEYCVIRVSSE